MRVQGAQVSFTAQHQFHRSQQVTALQVRARHATASSAESAGQQTQDNSSHLTIRRVAAQQQFSSFSLEAKTLHQDALGNSGVDQKLLTIKHILETYLGHEISVGIATRAESDNSENDDAEQNSTAAASDDVVATQEWVHLSLREAEKTSVGIRANITLQSGETREVVIEQRMARRLMIEKTMTAEDAAAYIDPLVINFGGPVQLSEAREKFDLNSDGTLEEIPVFASASAYVAWDKNGDGIVNDGSELFGVASGDGFADLAAYDDDGNGFIDSGDRIFAELVAFRPEDSSSSQPLRTLQSYGVEALYLDKVSSPFQITDDDGNALGRVRSTGFYLHQNNAGSLQQIDLVV